MTSKLISSTIVCISFLFCSVSSFAQDVDYYFVAHADDWQLFMSSNAHDDVVYYDTKVVFVTLTAGDGGDGDGGEGLKPYFKARENGSVKSAQFLANINSSGSKLFQSTATINKHKIKKYTYKNVVCYFLRLPDGNVEGEGFDGPDAFQSLDKFRTGDISQITAVDGSTTYTSWDDLCKTLKGIILREKGADGEVYINIPDTDMDLNGVDHSDHYNTGFAAEDAVADLPWVGIASFIGYGSQDSAVNLEISQIEDAAALHACDVIGMTEGGYESNWNDDYKLWLDKDYFRISRILPGDTVAAPAAKTKAANTTTTPKNTDFILNVYPNPVNKNTHQVIVEMELNQQADVKFFLTSNAGGAPMQLLERNIMGREKIIIPLKNGLASGVYYLTAIINNKIKNTRKLLIE